MNNRKGMKKDKNILDLMDEYEFLHFEIFPQVSIYFLIEDQYSKMYVLRTNYENCEEGKTKWINSFMTLDKQQTLIKEVHRCK